MTNALTRRLAELGSLPSEEQRALDLLVAQRLRHAGAREDLLREGEAPGPMRVVLHGWACRFKQLEDGRRQVVALLLPGDACHLHASLIPESDHDIGTITPVIYAEIPNTALMETTQRFPRILEALWRASVLEAAMQREWLLSLGQRSAFERLAHMTCEIFLRLRALGMTRGDACDFPLTQSDLADMSGLSAVYVNRTLQELRSAGLIVLKGKELQVPNLRALLRAAQFSPGAAGAAAGWGAGLHA